MFYSFVNIYLNVLLLNFKVFEVLKNTEGGPVLLNKLIPVSGDISEEKLGLSDEDEKMLCDNVNIVVHCAATLDFETDLLTAININLLGTKRIVDLSKKIKKLSVSSLNYIIYYSKYC